MVSLLGTIVVIVIFGCLSLVGLFIYRDHRNRTVIDADPDRLDLVGHMQHQSPTRPYSLTNPPGEILQVSENILIFSIFLFPYEITSMLLIIQYIVLIPFKG